MRLMLIDYSGHPFQAQLARAAAMAGNEVLHMHFAEFQTPKGRLSSASDDSKRLIFESVRLGGTFAKHNIIRRRFQEVEVGRRFAARMEVFAPDVVIASNLPLDALNCVQKKAIGLGIKFIFWQQDIYSEAIRRILEKKYSLLGTLVGIWYQKLERRIIRRSDAVVVISDDFTTHIRSKMCIDSVPIYVIENWAPLDEIMPRPKDNPWSRAHGLKDKKTVLYTGTLGMKHDPSLLLTLAVALRDDSNVRVVVASEGPAVDWLREQKRLMQLENLLLVGFQPFEAYSDVLGAGDVLMAILEDDAGVFSVPSKVLSYLCAGKPILFCGPSKNLAAKIVERESAGAVCESGERAQIVELASRLLEDQTLRSSMSARGRSYAEENFNIDTILDKFQKVISQIVVE